MQTSYWTADQQVLLNLLSWTWWKFLEICTTKLLKLIYRVDEIPGVLYTLHPRDRHQGAEDTLHISSSCSWDSQISHQSIQCTLIIVIYMSWACRLNLVSVLKFEIRPVQSRLYWLSCSIQCVVVQLITYLYESLSQSHVCLFLDVD